VNHPPGRGAGNPTRAEVVATCRPPAPHTAPPPPVAEAVHHISGASRPGL